MLSKKISGLCSAQVFLLDLQELDEMAYKQFYRAASTQRRRRADRYCRPEDAKCCVMSEILVRYVYRQVRQQTALPEFVYPSRGKPYLANDAGFHFNISHTGTMIAVGYAETELGIDIEQIARPLNRKGIAAAVFTPDEQAYVFEGFEEEQQNLRFTEVWTAKESYLKYLGCGFDKSLLSFSADLKNKTIVEKETGLVPELAICGNWLSKNYYLTMCGKIRNVSLEFPTYRSIIDAIL